MEDYKTSLESLCSPSKKAITLLIKDNKAELQRIKNRGNIPASGCSLLQDNMAQLDRKFQIEKSEHLKKLAHYEPDRRSLILKRAAKIKSMASTLNKKAINGIAAHISFTLLNNYKINIKNNTGYYISGSTHFDIFSKGIKIASTECNILNQKDKYGFDMGYYLSPHSKTKDYFCSYNAQDISSNPKLKLFSSQNKLPIDSRFQQHIIPDKVIVTDPIFNHKPVKQKAGSGFKYTSKPVSFLNIAYKGKYPENSMIEEIERSIDNETKRFEFSRIFKDYNLAKIKSDACNVNQVALEKTRNYQVKLDGIKTEVNTCINGKVDIQNLKQALISLERITNTHQLPDVDVLINNAAEKRVIQIIAGDSSRKTDTTINGLFKFNKVPKGEYLLYSDYKDSFVDGFWLTPITVKEDGQFDLNNNTFIDKSLDSYLEDSIAKIVLLQLE